MKMNLLKLANLILSITLLASPFLIGLTSSIAEYDPWADINNDGTIDIFDAIMLANAFGGSGEPTIKATIEYDSDWIDITDKCGQYFDIIHNFNSTEIMVDITGKTAVDGGVHQRSLGGTGFIHGWTQIYGGANSDMGSSVVQTIDGGYAFSGVLLRLALEAWIFGWLKLTHLETTFGTRHTEEQTMIMEGL